VDSDIDPLKGKRYKTIYADPPWQFSNRTGKMAPEHKRLLRYPTMKLDEICNLPIQQLAEEICIYGFLMLYYLKV